MHPNQARDPVDLAPLLAAIDPQQPQGTDIRQDPALQARYYDLKAMRRDLRHAERNLGLDPQTPAPENASWQKVMQTAEQLLCHQSKDLELACWYTEAQVKGNGLAGLETGLALLSGLINTYGHQLYPTADEEGVTTTLAPISGLNGAHRAGTLITAINLCPLFAHGECSVSAWDIMQAQQVDDQQDAVPSESDQPPILSLNDIDQIAAAIDANQRQLYHQRLAQAMQRLAELDQALNAQFAENAPALGQIEATLALCQQHLTNRLPLTESTAPKENKPQLPQEAQRQTTDRDDDRQQVMTTLSHAIGYYQQAEPHSPILWLLKRALRWASLSLPDILEEVLQNEQAHHDFSRMVGTPLPAHQVPPENPYHPNSQAMHHDVFDPPRHSN